MKSRRCFHSLRVRVHVVCAMAVTAYIALAAVDGLARMRAAGAMAEAATRFVASLTPAQKAEAAMAFDDPRRIDWHFIPRERKGIELGDLTEAQHKLAMDLVQTIGPAGALKVRTIIALDDILKKLEADKPATVQAPDGHVYKVNRGSGLYNVTVYGQPSDSSPWGWSIEGHHVSVNVAIVNGEIANTPFFLGAAPAEVRTGERKGLRPLLVEEDKARELLHSFDPEQRAIAVVSPTTHGDIVTYNERVADPIYPPRVGAFAMGLPTSKMTPAQKALLRQLIDEYLARMPEEVAAARAKKLYASDFDKIFFAWTGGTEPNQPHYYRVQGATFLIEFDASQTPSPSIPETGNHFHTVWRDFNGDFGVDLLREHYHATPHAAALIR